MKNVQLLLFALIMGAGNALASLPAPKPTAIGSEITSIDQITSGKKYLLVNSSTSGSRTKYFSTYVDATKPTNSELAGQSISSHSDIEADVKDGCFNPDHVWVITKNDQGQLAFCNAVTDLYIPEYKAPRTSITLSSEQGWYTPTPDSSNDGFTLKSASTTSNNTYLASNATGKPTISNTPNVYHLFEVTTFSTATYTVMNGQWVDANDQSSKHKAAGDVIANKAVGLSTMSIMPETGKTAWSAAYNHWQELTEYTQEEVDKLQTAYNQLLHALSGIHVRFQNKAAGNKYLAYDPTAQKLDLDTTTDNSDAKADNKYYSVFTIFPKDKGLCLYNEYSNAYLYTASGQAVCALVAEQAKASVWEVGKGFNAANGDDIFIALFNPGLHDYLTASSNHTDVTWGDRNSSNAVWKVEKVEHIDAANAFLAGSIHYVLPYNGTLPGQYNIDAQIKQAKELLANASTTNHEERRQKGKELRETLHKLDPNSGTGKFYRLKCGNRYISTDYTANNNQVAMIEATNAATAPQNTIFYFDADRRMVAYPTGLVFGKFGVEQAGNVTTQRGYYHKQSPEAHTSLTMSVENGTTKIRLDNGRWLKGDGAHLDAVKTDGNVGTSWTIELVENLPIIAPADSKGLFPFYSPVELSVAANSALEAYVVKDVTTGVTRLEKLTGNIPAATPVLLSLTDETSPSLPINYNPTSPTSKPALNILEGGIYTAMPNGSTDYYLGSEKGGKKGLCKYNIKEKVYLPGFSSYYVCAKPLDGENPQCYLVFDGHFTPGSLYTITAPNGCALIYDRAIGLTTTTAKGITLNSRDPNHQWGVYYDSNNNTYLYNAGAQQFANAFHSDAPEANNGQYDHLWGLQRVATPVTFSDKANVTCISGGDNTQGSAGLAVSGSNNEPVVCMNSGDKFTFTACSTSASAELIKSISNTFNSQNAYVASRFTYPDADITAEDNDEEFGRYPALRRTAFEEVINSMPKDASLDVQNYYCDNALKAMQPFERTKFVNEQVYELRNANGEPYHFPLNRYTPGQELPADANVVVASTVTDIPTDVGFYSWIAEVDNDGTTRLYQNWHQSNFYNSTGKRYLEWADGRSAFTVTLPADYQADGSNVAYVQLDNKFAANGLRADMAQVQSGNALVIYVTRNPNATVSMTTNIREVTTEGYTQDSSAAGCYDLQGRRVTSPTRGLYIQNGRPVRL